MKPHSLSPTLSPQPMPGAGEGNAAYLAFASGARLGTEYDLAAALAMSVSGIRKLRARGAVPAVKLGAAVRYHLPTVLKKLGVVV